MGLTVLNRPLGHKLTDAELDASVTDLSGEANFLTLFAHGLVDGDYIYVQSNIEAYNGYKYVDQTAYNTFKLRDSETGEFVQYYQDAEVTYRISVLAHGYIAVHKPIVYELQSDIYPINTGEESYYDPRIVYSQSDAEGYTQLELSTALTNPFALDWIELVGTGDLAGPYQIITVLQPWSIIIRLAYDSTNDFSGYLVVKYYNNYCVNINVWSGLPITHPWYAIKPYELAATLQLTPDALGKVKFSIANILKGYITLRNNLTLNTLPNNLDFMTGFYIEYFESYDSSDGTDLMTLTTAAISDLDEFEGHAVNADMPFKGVYISHLSEYINEDTYYAQWLLLQPNPITIVGYFFDLSFINRHARGDIQIFVNGVLDQTIPEPGNGVIRVPLEFLTAGQYCVYAYTPGAAQSAGPGAASLAALSAWTNKPGGQQWTLGANPVTSVNGNGGVSDWIVGTINTSAGFDYEFTGQFEIGVTGSSTPTSAITWALMDASYNVLAQVNFNYTTAGVKVETFTLNPVSAGVYLGFYVTNNTPFDTKNYDIESVTYNAAAQPDDSIAAQQITEEICITVLEECDSTFVSDEDMRLTEDGEFRILE